MPDKSQLMHDNFRVLSVKRKNSPVKNELLHVNDYMQILDSKFVCAQNKKYQ